LGAMRVGVHWDTEVKGGSHRVCQVLCSALPVAYAESVKSSDWVPLASVVLEGSYFATLAIVALLAAMTAVGGGAFGNRSAWIVNSMNRALASFAGAPLDVKLVHFGTVPRSTYKVLEKGRKPTRASRQAADDEATNEPPPAPVDAANATPGEGDEETTAANDEETAPAPKTAAVPKARGKKAMGRQDDPDDDMAVSKGGKNLKARHEEPSSEEDKASPPKAKAKVKAAFAMFLNSDSESNSGPSDSDCGPPTLPPTAQGKHGKSNKDDSKKEGA